MRTATLELASVWKRNELLCCFSHALRAHLYAGVISNLGVLGIRAENPHPLEVGIFSFLMSGVIMSTKEFAFSLQVRRFPADCTCFCHKRISRCCSIYHNIAVLCNSLRIYGSFYSLPLLHRHSYFLYPGPDFSIPFGRARLVQTGGDITVVTYGAVVQRALQAAQRLAREQPAGIEIL